jgi:hypothetical protein
VLKQYGFSPVNKHCNVRVNLIYKKGFTNLVYVTFLSWAGAGAAFRSDAAS